MCFFGNEQVNRGTGQMTGAMHDVVNNMAQVRVRVVR